jgi:hypothetical protein
MIKQTLAVCAFTILVPLAIKGSVMSSEGTGLSDCESRIPIAELPFVITERGSYVVVAPLVGESAVDGITILADHVNLDLNGFTVTGGDAVDGSTAGSYGGNAVLVSASWVTISNGDLSGWGEGGITAVGTRHRIENVQSESFGQATGISVGDDSVISNCSVTTGNNESFRAGANSRISNCFGKGLSHPLVPAAFIVGPNCVVEDCVSAGGFLAEAGTTLRRCRTVKSETYGIRTEELCKLEDCFSSEGIFVGPGSTVINCSASGWEQKFGSALEAGIGTRIAKSQFDGPVKLQDRCVMTDCRVTSPTFGLSVASDCLLADNQISQHGVHDSPGQEGAETAPALVVVGDRNRLERNTIDVEHAEVIFRIVGMKNVFVNNSVGSGPYSILPGNAYGPFSLLEGEGDLSLAPRHHLANYVN